MKKIIGIFFLIIAAWMRCGATQYYVSSSAGHDDTGNGTSANPWKTFGGSGNHINGGAFNPGDVIYLKRGDVWNEPLIPPSAGASGNPITFDAYGTGPAPVITAASAIPFVGASWTYVSGSAWKATIATTVSSGTVNFVQFGNLYGRKQPYGSGCASSIVNKYDWCLVWPSVYVYSPSGTNPVSTYATDGAIVPMVAQASGLAMISVVNKGWLVFQHIKVQAFDYMGVSVTGNSDNLVFANMEVDGMVPASGTPLGFYVNVASGYGTSIQFLNDDASLNYDGFKVNAAAAVTVKNCRGYANRDAGLRDNTASGTVVNYSYSHFYGNNVAQFPTTDVLNGVAGSGNVGLACGAAAGLPAGMCSSTVAPVVTNFLTYPARLSFTVDDVGSSNDTENYINGFLSVFNSRGVKFNAAVVPSYSVDWDSVRNWYASGNEIDSHSWSHQYYTTNLSPGNQTPYPNAPALDIQYTGSGTGATITIAGNVLSTTVMGASGDSIPSVNLANYTMQQLHDYLAGIAHYSVSFDNSGPLVRPNTHSANLMSVAGRDIKSAAAVLVYDQTKLVPDEMTWARDGIQGNVPGLSETFYVYPDGIEDPTTEADAIAAGYTAARGSLAMKGQDNTTGSANSFYANGVNVQNITSLAAIQTHGLTRLQVQQMAASLVFRAAAWGIPYGFFTHYNTRGDNAGDISNAELGTLLDAITAGGGTWLTNMALASAVTSGTGLSGTTRYVQNPTGAALNLAMAAASSPTVGHGVATSYPIDLNGVDRSLLGAWDIGASEFLSQRYGTGAGAGSTVVGATLSGVPFLMESTVPSPAPGGGCPAGWTHSAANWYCDFVDGSAGTGILPHLNAVNVRMYWTDVDTGTTGPNYSGWATADARVSNFALYAGNGNTIASISNTGGVTTVTMAANSSFAPTPTSDVCIGGNSNPDYNGCFSLNGAPGATYSANHLISMTFSQPVSHASGTGGYVAFGCGRLLPGSTGISACKIVPIWQHHANQVNASSPLYPFTQGWANSSAGTWAASAACSIRQNIKVGSQYFHNTAIGGTTGVVAPAWNTTAGTTTADGTCAWYNDGANALPQETMVGTQYTGGTNTPPSSVWIANGYIFNINSTACGSSGTSACATSDVATGMPLWFEIPWRKAYNLFHTSLNDGNGNPGLIQHYKIVPWAAQIAYVPIGGMDLGEWFGWLEPYIKSPSWLNLTYAQYKAAMIDDYAADSFRQNAAAYYMGGAPSWQLNTRTNGYSGSAGDGNSLDYSSEILKVAKQASPSYAFGNQGALYTDPQTYASQNWATTMTGFWEPYFDQYKYESGQVYHHLQPSAPGGCPANGNQAHCTQTELNEGSMAIWLPFGKARGMSAFEGFLIDALCTWDSNYTVANGVTGGPEYADCQTDSYQSVWNTVASTIQPGLASIQCAPPNYCSSYVMADPGTISPILSSTSSTGKITCTTSPNTCTWQSGSNFTWSKAATYITINNAPNTVASVTDGTHFVPGTPVNGTNVNFALCDGQCQNSTAYDTTIPGYEAGTNCITRLTDASTISNGQSIGNLTCSGGANNAAISSLGNYIGPVNSGGSFRIQHVAIQNGCLKVVNTGIPPLSVSCPAGFAQAPSNDQTAYYMKNTTELHKTSWDANATAFTSDTVLVDFANCPGLGGVSLNVNSEMTESINDDVFSQAFGTIGGQGFATVLSFYRVSTNQCRSIDFYSGNYYDWCTPGASCANEAPLGQLATVGNICFGIPKWEGQVTVEADGQTVDWVPGSGQKFGFTTLQTLSLHQGNSCSASGGIQCVFGFSIVSGTQLKLSSQTTAVKLGCSSLPCITNYSVINGIHSVQASPGGNYSHIAFGANGGWGVTDPLNPGGLNPSVPASLNTACAGSTQNTQIIEVPVASSNNVTQWGSATNSTTQGVSGYQFAGHPSEGLNNVLVSWYTGFNIRPLADITHWTPFTGTNNNLFFDSHGTWPHFCANKITGDDSCPWMQASDNPQTSVGTGTCGNPVYCPKYWNLVLSATYPTVAYPPGRLPNIFTHLFICGNGNGAQCNDGPATQFGEINAISYTDPQGRYTIWTSSMLHSFGNDSSGAKESDALGVVLH